MKMKTERITMIAAAIIIAAICIFAALCVCVSGTPRTASAESGAEKEVVFQQTNSLSANNGKAAGWLAANDYDDFKYEFYCIFQGTNVSFTNGDLSLYIADNGSGVTVYDYSSGMPNSLMTINSGISGEFRIDITSESVRVYSLSQGTDISFDNASKEYNACERFFLKGEIQIYRNYTLRETLTLYKTRAVVELPEAPEKEGYTFVGWYYDAEFTRPYNGEAIYEDTELYAKYEVTMCEVVFDAAGGTDVPSVTVEWGTAVELPTTEQDGYTFAGWYYADGTKYEAQAIKENTTLIAYWDVNKISGSFYVDGELYASEAIDYGSTFNPDCEVEVVFTESNDLTNSANTGKAYAWFEGKKYDWFTYYLNFDGLSLGKSDNEYGLILQLQYAYGQLTLTDFSNHGEKEILSIPYSEYPNKAIIITSDSLTFRGDTREYPVGSTEYAVITEFLFGSTFDNLTGESADEMLDLYSYHSVAMFPGAPEKEGHTFVGWCFDEELTQLYQEGYCYEDVNFYAKYEINRYEVTFDVAGGTPVSNITVEWNTAVELPITERVGYDFAGWFLPDGTQYQEQQITENTVLTAQWTIKKFVVTFYVDDEVYTTKEVEYGTRLMDVLDAEKSLEVIAVLKDNVELDIAAYSEARITEDYDLKAQITQARRVQNMLGEYPWLFAVAGGALSVLVVVSSCIITKRR